MTATRFIPVHLPELADCEAPAPDHEGRPQHVPIYNPTGVTLALQPYGPEGLCIVRGFIKLSAACEWFGIVNKDAHDAMGDAEAAYGLLSRLIADNRIPEARVHYAAAKADTAAA